MTKRRCFYFECETTTDLRPYGPNGAYVCFECAMTNLERRKETEQNFANLLLASGPVAVIEGTEAGVTTLEESLLGGLDATLH